MSKVHQMETAKDKCEESLRIIENFNGKVITIPKNATQRAIGDILENISIELFISFEDDFNYKVLGKLSPKSTEDLTLKFTTVNYCIDVKSCDIHGDFSMPNLTAIDKIKYLLCNEDFNFRFIMLHYEHINDYEIRIVKVDIIKIQDLPWDNLVIGNLGNGQLQIKDMHKFYLNVNYPIQNWYREFNENVLKFKYKQLSKIQKSITVWENMQNDKILSV